MAPNSGVLLEYVLFAQEERNRLVMEERDEKRYSIETTKKITEEKRKSAKGEGFTFRPYVDDVRTRLEMVVREKEKIREPSNKKLLDRLRSQGKITARERLDLLFDEGTFSEMSIFARSQIKTMGMENYDTPADGIISGFGEVNGQLVCAYATDYTVLAGSTGEGHAAKITSIMRMAGEMRVPIVAFLDSSGARLQEAINCLKPGVAGMLMQSIYSGVVPQISVVCGGCAAGQAYGPLLTDFVIMTKNADMWLGGPRATSAVTGAEDISDIGSADYHMKYTGECHFSVDDDGAAIEMVKVLLKYLPSSCDENPPAVVPTDPPNRREERLLDILPKDPRRSYDMHEIIRLIVDDGEFLEVQKGFAKNGIVCFCRFGGEVCGIVAGNPSYLSGCMEPDVIDKYTHFISFCDCFNIPLVYLVDMPALLVGDYWERKGIIRHGTKLLQTTLLTTVPRISVIVRKSYGGAVPIFSMKPYSADYVYGWPNSELCPMGADSAVAIIYDRQMREMSPKDRLAFSESKKREYFENHIDPLTIAGNMRLDLFDDILDPRDTREVIIKTLKLCKRKKPLIPIPERKHRNRPD